MNRNESINYMISSEGFRTFLVEALNKSTEYARQALENEFTSILDDLCKSNEITGEQYKNWKCPSLRYVCNRLKIEKVWVYV